MAENLVTTLSRGSEDNPAMGRDREGLSGLRIVAHALLAGARLKNAQAE